MLSHTRRKLERLQRLLDEMQALVGELVGSADENRSRTASRETFDVHSFLESIKNSERSKAELLLAERSHRELGAVFMAAGGTSVDAKKPKDWLVRQILWRIFDFQRGHEAIRSGE